MCLSIEEICQKIINAPAPIIFFDACSIVDIVRTPDFERSNIPQNTIFYAKFIIELLHANPKKLWILTSEIVKTEAFEHIDNEKEKLEKKIKKHDDIRVKFISCANDLLNTNNPSGLKIQSIDLAEHLKYLAQNVLNHCLVAKVEDIHTIKGFNRVLANKLPAKKGKSEPKDCVILESLLDVSEKLRSQQFSEKIIFITSNINDFGKPSDISNNSLNNDFYPLNIIYVTNLEWASKELGIN